MLAAAQSGPTPKPTTPATPASAAAAALPDYKDEGGVFEQYDTTVRMHADGTGERTDHVRLRVQSEGVVRAFGVLAISFASAYSTGTIEHVTVHKADGTDVVTPASEALEVAEPVTREAPMYSDMKQVQLPVRGLSAGDRLEYELHTVYTKPEAPGQFWGAERILPFDGVTLSRTVTLEVPAGKYVQVWSPKHPAERSTGNGTATFVWKTAQLTPTAKADGSGEDAKPAVKDPDEDADGRKLPSLAWTTFHNWGEVGEWYRSLALERAQPDATLRARAEQLTKDAKTPQEQVLALYDFVAARIRYVGIDLGVGRFQPHAAGQVLSNQYGDCKDKDTLLEALLRARGFSVAPALIGAGITPVPEVPSPAVFNHVITTVMLPGGRVWLDSTAEVAPFEYLVPQIRDQEALVVPDKDGATLMKSPAAPPYAFRSAFHGVGELSASAEMKASITGTYRNDEEIVLRALARNLAPAEWDKGSQFVSYQTGFSGTTSNTRFRGANNLDAPVEIQYDYLRKDYGNPEAHQIVPLLPVTTLLNEAEATKEPEHDLLLGVPRKEVADSRIRLPQGWHVDLPDAVHEQSAWAEFDKTYRFVQGEVITERTVTVLQAKVPHAQWKAYQQFCKRIDLGNEHWIQVMPAKAELKVEKTAGTSPAGKDGSGPKTAAVSEGASTASAAEDGSVESLRRVAFDQMRANQLAAARETLDRLRAKDADADYLHAWYGWLAEQNGQTDEAIAEYRKEASLNRYQATMAVNVARVQEKQGKAAEARETLQTAYAKYPDEAQVGIQLARSQYAAKQYSEAAGTWQTMANAHPETTTYKVNAGECLLAAGRREEAAAVAKSVLDGSTDAGELNSAGYLLAETGEDLPVAEAASRRSIAMVEEKSRGITLDEVNSGSFAQSNLLVASWDTLGWILLREGKLDDAEPYLAASWRNDLEPEVGEHLGRLLEQRGDLTGATAQYRAAQAAFEGNNASEKVREAIAADLARMGSTVKPEASAGVQQRVQAIEAAKELTPVQKRELVMRAQQETGVGSVQHSELQEMRTFRLARPAGAKGWGTVRLQLSAAGVQAAEQSSGDATLSAALPALRTLKFPGLVPAGSKAFLLRSGVLSCSVPERCDLVLVPNATLATEQHQ